MNRNAIHRVFGNTRWFGLDVPVLCCQFCTCLEIRKRLSELKLGNSATSHIEQLLVDLKTQEGKNQLALDALQKQMRLLQATSKCR